MSLKVDTIFSEIVAGDAIKKALSLTPKGVVEIVKNSELRGRGGAGFPTGLKWELAAKSDSTTRYIVCNADEGEPGTFKDRKILELQSGKVIEAMIIAGYAVGASSGYIYLRGEYRYLKGVIEKTILQYQKQNLIGDSILGNDKFSFEVKIFIGAGAYICGEETALLNSLESRRGSPRNKPPFPVSNGYLGKPTVVNNVETLSFIPHIILKGAKWFHKFGTQKSVGSKLFSVSGDCTKPGIYEFEFGLTIKELLNEVSANGKTKAVQIGGASGFCASREDFDKTISFEGVPTGGSIIIFDETRDMFKVLKNFAEFFRMESCGQCTPCREGCARLVEGLEMFENGLGSSKTIDNLLELCETMQLTSKCGLGQSVPNSFRSIAQKFRDEIIVR
jgi:[NiFe] hydrogenase diaphorase moiety large subunit